MARTSLATEVYDTPQKGPRIPNAIGYIVIHHAATESFEAVVAMENSGSRTVSSTIVLKDNRVASMFDEAWRAWSLSSQYWDSVSLSSETCNSGGAAQGWPISEASYKTLAAVIAEWCVRYGIPCDRTHIMGHREVYTRHGASYATACPGGIDLDRLVAMAYAIINGTGKRDEMTTQYHYINDDGAKAALGIGAGAWFKRAAGGSPLEHLTPGQASEAFRADGIDSGPFAFPQVWSRSGAWLLAALAEDNANRVIDVKAHPWMAQGKVTLTEADIAAIRAGLKFPTLAEIDALDDDERAEQTKVLLAAIGSVDEATLATFGLKRA